MRLEDASDADISLALLDRGGVEELKVTLGRGGMTTLDLWVKAGSWVEESWCRDDLVEDWPEGEGIWKVGVAGGGT